MVLSCVQGMTAGQAEEDAAHQELQDRMQEAQTHL